MAKKKAASVAGPIGIVPVDEEPAGRTVRKKDPTQTKPKPRYPKIRPNEERRLRRLIRGLEKELGEAKNSVSAYQAKLDKANKGWEDKFAKNEDLWKAKFDSRTKEYKDALAHPRRLESQVKDFALVLNVVFRIGVRMVDEWVIFRKGEYDLRVSLNNIMLHGIGIVPKMLAPVPSTTDDPQNNIDGVEGWEHPDFQKDPLTARKLAYRIARRYRLED